MLQKVKEVENLMKQQADNLEKTVQQIWQKQDYGGRPEATDSYDKDSRKKDHRCAHGHSDTSDKPLVQTAAQKEVSNHRGGTSSEKSMEQCQEPHTATWEEIELKTRNMAPQLQTGSAEIYEWFRNRNREPEQNPHGKDWIEKCWQRDSQQCKCFNWNQRCWADSAETWDEHTGHCPGCRGWERKGCPIVSHGSVVKQRMMRELSKRSYIDGRVMLRNGESTCCMEMTCIHDFIRHWRFDVPWWACVNGQCYTHFRQKRLNRVFPRIPRISILNAQRCPCLRLGCACQYSRKHPFHFDLCKAQNCIGDLPCEPHESWQKIWRIQKQGSWESADEARRIERLLQSAERIARGVENFNVEEHVVRSAHQDEPSIRIKVRIGGVEGHALIDSGSTANFLSDRFAREIAAETENKGTMTVTRFDGTKAEFPLEITTVRYWIQGQGYQDEFRIIPMGDGTQVILGYPWMKKMNPRIDWQRKRVQLPRAQTSGEKKGCEGNSPPQQGALIQLTPEAFSGRGETSNNTYQKPTAMESEKHVPEFEYVIPQKEYEERKAEVRRKLPRYLWQYEEVFCPRV
jgi:hypothetical protein